MPLANYKACIAISKACKGYMVGLKSCFKNAEKPVLELTNELLGSVLVCQEWQTPRKSPGICQL